MQLAAQQKVIVYGSGSSARYFIEHYRRQYQIVAIVEQQPAASSVMGFPCMPHSAFDDIEYDAIVVASWAIQDIRQRLVDLGISEQHIFWFQHNKNRIVHCRHSDAEGGHLELQQQQILYAVFDLNVARATFDILGFLCLADLYREEQGFSAMHLLVVNAQNNDFNVAARGVIAADEHRWRKRQVLSQCAGLIASCVGVTFTACRDEARPYCAKPEQVFPQGYQVDKPIACWEFNELFAQTRQGKSVARLQAAPQAIAIVQQWLQAQQQTQRKMVTITLRDSAIKPKRNSQWSQWRDFIAGLDPQYLPVIVPDTDAPVLTDVPDNALVYSEACFNVELRMALYELAWGNLGVNNGPMHLCALSPRCCYLMFKQVVEDYAHTSTQSFLDRGFTIGGEFPGAVAGQHLIWLDDDLATIKQEFDRLVIEADNLGDITEEAICPT